MVATLNLSDAQLAALKQEARLELARRDFWEFAKLKAPDFYSEDRHYLKKLCTELQEFYFSDDKVMIVNMPPRHGKDVENSTPVLTNKGWKKHGDLEVGDYVFNPEGQTIRVLEIHPKLTDVRYWVETTTGEKILAHPNHEWVVYDRHAHKYKTVETKYMIGKLEDGGSERKRGHRYRFQLPLVKPLEGVRKELPVDPYTFGAWLGDGTNTDPIICAHPNDNIILSIIDNVYEPSKKWAHKTTGVEYAYYPQLRVALQIHGLCFSGHHNEKYIPDEYLTASLKQRLELLAGLLDTDGSLRKKERRYVFTTAEESLKNDFVSLIATFGWRTCVREIQPTVSTSGVVGRHVYWQISFNPTMYIPCYIERKQLKEFSKQRKIAIKSITPLQTLTQGNCITVEGGVYLVGRQLVPTHNSRTAQLFTEWIFGNNPNEKVLTGSYNEQLSTTFSRAVRDAISEKKASKNRIVYCDIFPHTKIKRGSSAANMWTLEGAHVSYLATSPSGTVTGFGGSLMIIDDIVKNAEEAYNETILEKHWTWFCFTGDTLVKTINGDKPIKDIGIGDKVLTFNHSQYIIEEKEVVRVDSHLDSIYRLEFENGQEIECTGNHRFYTNRGYLSIEQILSAMRCSVKEGQTVLFSDLQKQSESWESEYDNVPELRKRNSVGKEESSDEILFYRLQERVSSETGDEPLCWMGEIEGQLEERTSSMSTMWNNRTSSSTSYRPQHKKQSIRQSDCTVPIVPFKLSQITRVPSTDVRRVYDIEVKDNHNFFANNILVHNCNTMLSRLEKGGKVIIIATRWHSDDLSGRALRHYQSIGVPVRLILETALQADGTMLCDGVLDKESYELIVKTMGKDIAEANYNQRPVDMVGRLYQGFKTYSQLPTDESGNSLFEQICCYCDTADRGDDYLCAYIFGVYNKQAYVLDTYFTKDGMEITEPELAKRLYEHKVQKVWIESNNGGRGFGRSVERILREKHHYHRAYIDLFYQSKNKKARILGAATWVQENVFFPAGWEVTMSELYNDLYKYQKEGRMAHDDAEDALSGIYEKLGRGSLYSFE